MNDDKNKLEQATMLFELANACQMREEYELAADYYNQLLSLIPNNIQALYQLGRVKHLTGQTRESISILEKALSFNHSNSDICFSLGVAYSKLGQEQKALIYYEKSIFINPEFISAYINSARSHIALGNNESARQCYEKAISINPNSTPALLSLAVLTKTSDPLASIKLLEKVVDIDPTNKDAYNQLASIYSFQLKQDEANAALKHYLTIDNSNNHLYSAYLFSLLYNNDIDPDYVLSESKQWASIKKVSTPNSYNNSRLPERPIRIGFVSADFVCHPVMSFFTPIVKNIDKSSFTIHCFSNVEAEDDCTRRLKTLVHEWINIRGLTDIQACRLIQSKDIDILFDLGGHTAGNRIDIFSRKPAPIQVSYIGYPSTTGLTTIDYRITDGIADPIGKTEKFHTEKLLRLPHTFLTFAGLDNPINSSPPCVERKSITFGCFNNYLKLSKHTLQLWSLAMHRVPNSILLLKSSTANYTDTRNIIVRRFHELGISEDRILFSEHIPNAHKHRDKYNSIDIALDAFPYNGTTTTFEALWMGVPVVTLVGKLHLSRVSASILTNAGLENLIAHSEQEFADICEKLASNTNLLQTYRATLRNKLLQTPLGNPALFIRDFEHILRNIWLDWCSLPHDDKLAGQYFSEPSTDTALDNCQQVSDLTLRLPGDIAIVLPNDINNLFTYVIIEQDDWYELELDFIRKIAYEGMNSLDIGANYGIYTLTLAHYAGNTGNVFSYATEAEPSRYLKQSIEINNFTNIKVFNDLSKLANAISDLTSTSGKQIEIVRIDPTADMVNILTSIESTLKSSSPILLVSLCAIGIHETQHHNLLSSLGYETYRLIHSLKCLVPYDVKKDSELGNIAIFYIKKERASLLNRQGALCLKRPAGDSQSLTPSVSWMDVLRLLPYTKKIFSVWIRHTHRTPSPYWEQYEHALNLYISSRFGNCDIDEKYALLVQSLTESARILNLHANVPRLLTTARICFDLNLNSTGINLLNNIHNVFARGYEIEYNEPFIPLRIRFEHMDTSASTEKFCRANVLEQWAFSVSKSSYFEGSGYIEPIMYERTLGFDDVSLDRRRSLHQFLHSPNSKLVASTALTTPSPNNINAEFWKSISNGTLKPYNSKYK